MEPTVTTPNIRMAQRLLSEADLRFVVEDATGLAGADRLRVQLATDEGMRTEVLGAERLFRRVVALDEAFVRISPRLFFEVLLRRALQELARTVHVIERSGSQHVPVFVGEEGLRVIAQSAVRDYLADMLASFTRVESHTVRVRVRRGVWHKARYSDMDVTSLLRLAQQTDEAQRMPVYKRAGDACLLILGMFPDFAATATRYPGTGAPRPRGARLGTEEYEHIAVRAYRLAAEHPAAAGTGVAEPMLVLSEHVLDAKRPLGHIAERYLRLRRGALFGVS